jgi:hypothetical protein
MYLPEWIVCFACMRRLVGTLVIAALVTLVLFAAWLGYGLYDQSRRWTPEQVEQAAREALPPGSTRAEVVSFLESKSFPYESYSEYRHVRIVGTTPDWFGEAICGHVPKPGLGLLAGGTISVCFFLDKQGRLVTQNVDVWRYTL